MATSKSKKKRTKNKKARVKKSQTIKKTKTVKNPKKQKAPKKPKLKMKIKKGLETHKKHILSFSHKGWSIIVFLFVVLAAFVIQSILEAKIDPDIVKANITQVKSSAREAFKINPAYDIIHTEKHNRGHYIASGDTEIDVFSFGIKTKENTIILKETKVSLIGDISDEHFLKAKLFEGENVIAESKIHDSTFYFKNFTSVLQEGTYKEYIVKLDISENIKAGSRFKFSILSPYDILLEVDDKPVYALDQYPVNGAFVTVIGWR